MNRRAAPMTGMPRERQLLEQIEKILASTVAGRGVGRSRKMASKRRISCGDPQHLFAHSGRRASGKTGRLLPPKGTALKTSTWL